MANAPFGGHPLQQLRPDLLYGTLDNRLADQYFYGTLQQGLGAFDRGLGDRTAGGLNDALNQALRYGNWHP